MKEEDPCPNPCLQCCFPCLFLMLLIEKCCQYSCLTLCCILPEKLIRITGIKPIDESKNNYDGINEIKPINENV